MNRLPVLDLTALRFQPPPATDLPVKGNSNHDQEGRFASGGMKLAPPMGGAGGGEKSSDLGSMTSQELADFVRDNPESPEALACKAWAVQDFSAIKRELESERSRSFLAAIRRIEPYQSTEPLFRGERCKTAALRDAFIASIKEKGGYAVARVASSFSKDREVALEEFTGEHGVLLHLHEHTGMRDFEPVVKQVAPEFAYQREVLAPEGLRFIFLGESDAEGTPVLHLATEAV